MEVCIRSQWAEVYSQTAVYFNQDPDFLSGIELSAKGESGGFVHFLVFFSFTGYNLYCPGSIKGIGKNNLNGLQGFSAKLVFKARFKLFSGSDQVQMVWG
jgi:hypothetical protein